MLQIDSVFFIEYIWVFTENMLLINNNNNNNILGNEPLLIQAIVYLKTNTTLHTYGLQESWSILVKMCPYSELAIFHTDPYFVQKDP